MGGRVGINTFTNARLLLGLRLGLGLGLALAIILVLALALRFSRGPSGVGRWVEEEEGPKYFIGCLLPPHIRSQQCACTSAFDTGTPSGAPKTSTLHMCRYGYSVRRMCMVYVFWGLGICLTYAGAF